MIADGLDAAILGIDAESLRLIYSKNKCLKIRMSEGFTEEEALEDLMYNTWGAYVGEGTPIWCDDLI